MSNSMGYGVTKDLAPFIFAVPPKKVVVMDERGLELNSLRIGPYPEGSSMRLTCVSTGGNNNEAMKTYVS